MDLCTAFSPRARRSATTCFCACEIVTPIVACCSHSWWPFCSTRSAVGLAATSDGACSPSDMPL